MKGKKGIICSTGTNGFDSSISPKTSSVAAGICLPAAAASLAASWPMKSLWATSCWCFPFADAW